MYHIEFRGGPANGKFVAWDCLPAREIDVIVGPALWAHSGAQVDPNQEVKVVKDVYVNSGERLDDGTIVYVYNG